MAATSALTEGRTKVAVRLSQIPVDLRQAVAHELAKAWGLAGVPFVLFLARATDPAAAGQDPVLEVDAEKWALVQAGRRPTGPTPAELKVPPDEYVALETLREERG